MRRATIDFAHYVHENVSILCRSACPPPAAGDKEPVHCGCLICVTEGVCAKIDVAFHSTVCGPCWGLLLLVCLSLLSLAAKSFVQWDHRIYINTDVVFAFDQSRYMMKSSHGQFNAAKKLYLKRNKY